MHVLLVVCLSTRKLYYLVQSKKFEYVLMAVIITNSSTMATTFYGMSEHMSSALENINYAFTCLYVLEFLMKVLAWMLLCLSSISIMSPCAAHCQGCLM